MADWLTGIGLAVNMLGAASVFFFGFPQPEIRGHSLLLASSPSEEELEARRAKRRRLSYVGMGLLVVGFGLQLWGLLISE